ncbi:hypothetical protein ACQ4PT_021229 [Festuca glaucescens]
MVGERQSTCIRSLYLEAVLKQDISFFDVEMTTGEAISMMSADTVLVQDALGEKVGKYAQLLTTFIGAVSRLRAQISARRQASYGDAGNVVEQSTGAIRTVVSFNGEKKAIASYNSLIKKAYKATVLERIVTGLGIGCIFCVVFCSYSLAFWYGAKLIISNEYTGGQVINVVFAILTGSMAIGNASPSISAIAEGQSAAHRLFEIINRKPKIDITDTSGIVLDDIKGDVELNNVLFRYPARPEQMILNGLSLKVPSGTTMAIVGESGSGKSTLLSLVERFYDPQAGEVLIDGINIKTLKLQWIRGKISLVSQEPLLFMTSIKDNITYGKEDATLEEIKRAAELANAANFVEKLPNAYETMVGQNGAQLSGGQKQRIAIARAILKNPRVLLLDEATSALDVESERVVQEALNRIMVGITTLIVAHRMSTVRNADCIAVVHQGKVVEQGAHDQLIKDPDGAYCQLTQLQQAHTDEMREVPSVSDSRLKSTSLSIEKSIRDSPRNRRQQSIKLLGLSGSDDLHGHERVRALSFKSIMHQEVSWFDDSSNSSGALGARLSVDALNIRSLVGDNLAILVQCTVTLVSGFAIAFVSDWKLTLIIIGVIPFLGLQNYIQVKFLKGFSEDAKVYFALVFTAFGIAQTSAMASDSTKARESATSILALIDMRSKINSTSDEGIKLDKVDGNIHFNHVTFKYPSRPDVQVFSDFTLGIPSRKTFALVGESGSGKSTVIALLERFYDPDSGTISLDGIELKNLTLSWLRDQMGLVSQEPVLFNDTIRANIAYGKRGEATEEEIITVTKAANAHEFISSLPQGYNTSVGERGTQLSGGQKQRVAIARAILKDPRILLLDEATSALDAESERIVQDTLDQVMVSRTTIVVAHRLSTIKGADMIAVIKDGSVAEKGKHESLMSIKDGVYASLVELHSKAS